MESFVKKFLTHVCIRFAQNENRVHGGVQNITVCTEKSLEFVVKTLLRNLLAHIKNCTLFTHFPFFIQFRKPVSYVILHFFHVNNCLCL